MKVNGKIKVGMAQLLVEGGEPERNFERACKLIDKAAEAQCHVVVLPETIDFAWTHPRSIDESRPIPGDFSDIFCQKAKQHQIFICLGLTEKVDAQTRYNTALLINEQGEIELKYHKINLLDVEHPYYKVGQTLNIVDTPLGKIGVNICADNYIESLTIAHTLARMGAQIILSPASWTVDHSITEEHDPYQDKWIKPLSTIATLYDLVMISTTSVGYIVGGPYEGKKMVGRSVAINKDGIIAEGMFNEFAGNLTIAEFEVPNRTLIGTQIGDHLRSKGYQFESI